MSIIPFRRTETADRPTLDVEQLAAESAAHADEATRWAALDARLVDQQRRLDALADTVAALRDYVTGPLTAAVDAACIARTGRRGGAA